MTTASGSPPQAPEPAQPAAAPQALGRQIAMGGITLVVLRLAVRLIGLVSIILLFRILAPEDFGLVATAMIVVGFVEIFAEFGFDQALLRNPEATAEDYNTTWTLNAMRGVAVCVILLAAAPLAASMLDDARLKPILWALALAPLLDGLASTGVIEFARNLDFQKEFKLKVSQKLLSFFVTLAAALLLRNYWALVIGTLTGKLVGLGIGYWMHPFRPRFGLHGAGQVLRFSSWQLANSIVLYLGNQADKVATQKLFSASAVGILRIAEEVSSMVMEFVWPIERALIAGYTKLIAQQQKLRDTVLTTIGCIAALGVPLSVSLAALADPAIKLVLGDKGIPAIPFVQAFAIHGALRSTMSGIFPLFFTLGKPRINTHATFLSVAVRLSALLVLFPIVGVISAPYCLALGTLVSWSYVWFKLNRELELPWHAMPRILMRPLLASGVLLVIGLSITTALPDWPPAAILLLAVPACAAGYVGSSLLLWRMADSPPGPEAIFIGWARRRIAARMARS